MRRELMNFQDLLKVETPKTYLDTAFKRAKKDADDLRMHTKGTRLTKSRRVEAEKIRAIDSTLTKSLQNILHSFPSLRQLDTFYVELIKLTLDYREIKRALGAVNWCKQAISKLSDHYHHKILRATEFETINAMRREYYGRVSSLIKQIRENLEYLEKARKVMKGYPAIKTGMFTVCICGFPNVGKSTLLSKLSSAKPEIKEYAFTTKGLNTGYMKEGYINIQLIDTPGTLNRFEKMNMIEKMAYLAVLHCADAIIYVYDLTEPYPLKDQQKLYSRYEAYKRPILVYLSKTDILDSAILDQFHKHGMAVSPSEVKKLLAELGRNHLKREQGVVHEE